MNWYGFFCVIGWFAGVACVFVALDYVANVSTGYRAARVRWTALMFWLACASFAFAVLVEG